MHFWSVPKLCMIFVNTVGGCGGGGGCSKMAYHVKPHQATHNLKG